MSTDANARWRAAIAQPLNLEPFNPVSMSLKVDIAAGSECGRLRSHNTDHFLALRIGRLQETLSTSLAAADLPPRFEEYGYAMLVADGLDEQGGGARASRLALSAVAHLLLRYGQWNVRVGPDTLADITGQGAFLYRQVHEAVRSATDANFSLATMATGLTAAYIAEQHLFFAHVGHGRAYLFRDGVLTQLTEDHTMRQRGTKTGEPWPHGTRDFSHVVTETLGAERREPATEMEHITLASGDRVLLCTNGLTDVVDDERIADTLALQRRPADDCQRLIELAHSQGSPDDVTVIVAEYRTQPNPASSETSR